MKLLPLADKVARCTAVSLSPNRKYFAVVEEGVGADGPSVGVYSVATEKRVKVLSPAAAGTGSAQVVEMSWRCGGACCLRCSACSWARL